MNTDRLHYDDPLRFACEARVVAHHRYRAHASVELDRTVFYAEAGGQLADLGWLRGEGEAVRVLDVQLHKGVIHHLVDGVPPPVGERVSAEIDPARRREHMALHTAQHALSRALLDDLGAVTVSSRLGQQACTIDIDRAGVSASDVEPAFAKVQALIEEDRAVRQYFPSDEALRSLSLRKPPPDTDAIRVVDIDGFDVTPCGGTHCTHTAQMQLVVLTKVERYKGMTRVTFAAGPRARRWLTQRADLASAAAARLRVAPDELVPSIERLLERERAAKARLGRLAARRMDERASALLAGAVEGAVIAQLPPDEREWMQGIVDRLRPQCALVALAAPLDASAEAGGELDVVIARGPSGDRDCQALLATLIRTTGGRGGGRPAFAQGRLPAPADWVASVRHASGSQTP